MPDNLHLKKSVKRKKITKNSKINNIYDIHKYKQLRMTEKSFRYAIGLLKKNYISFLHYFRNRHYKEVDYCYHFYFTIDIVLFPMTNNEKYSAS